MFLKEFSEELQQYIFHGSEEVNLEYKRTMSWHDRNVKLKIAKAMLAMSNMKNGGVIVVGVQEDGTPNGMILKDVESYKYDEMAKWLNSKTTPAINFQLNPGKITDENGEKYFAIIQVRESKDIPIIFTGEHEREDLAQPLIPKNIYLRKNALYIRAKSPIESREISSYTEWQDFIELLLERNQETLVQRLPCYRESGHQRPKGKSDEEKFTQQLANSSL